MKIIGIVGVWDKADERLLFWQYLKESFEKEFPGSEFITEHEYYMFWEIRKIKEFITRIIATYDNGEELIFVGHSLGGLVALVSAIRLKNSKMRLLVTINSPHAVVPLRKALGIVPRKFDFPVLSFAGMFDVIVPFFVSKYKYATKHKILKSAHLLSYVRDARFSKQIAEESWQIYNSSFVSH